MTASDIKLFRTATMLGENAWRNARSALPCLPLTQCPDVFANANFRSTDCPFLTALIKEPPRVFLDNVKRLMKRKHAAKVCRLLSGGIRWGNRLPRQLLEGEKSCHIQNIHGDVWQGKYNRVYF